MHIMHYDMHNLHYDMHILENYQAGIYFKRTIYYGKWQHIKLKGTKKHPPWSADCNVYGLRFISVKLVVVLANNHDSH